MASGPTVVAVDTTSDLSSGGSSGAVGATITAPDDG